jgi:hypothetical protein
MRRLREFEHPAALAIAKAVAVAVAMAVARRAVVALAIVKLPPCSSLRIGNCLEGCYKRIGE